MSKASILDEFDELLSKLDTAILVANELEEEIVIAYLNPIYNSIADMRASFNQDEISAEALKTQLANGINLQLVNLSYQVNLKAILCPFSLQELEVNADDPHWYFNQIHQPIMFAVSHLSESLDDHANQAERAQSPSQFFERKREESFTSFFSEISYVSSTNDDEVFALINQHYTHTPEPNRR